MTKHKIFSEIGLKDEEMVVNLSEEDKSRTADWEQQRKEYGFDERETWAMEMNIFLLMHGKTTAQQHGVN